MAGAAARALQYEYKAVGVNFMYEKLKATPVQQNFVYKRRVWILQQ